MSNDTPSLEDLIARLRQFNLDRDWSQFHTPRSVTLALTAEVGELASLLRWTPEIRRSDRSPDAHEAAAMKQELGDVFLTFLNLCESCGVDPLDAAYEKLTINAANYPVASSRGRAERP
jgi:NTP pyrophosphatase (non-canonical NTP hydrolase)